MVNLTLSQSVRHKLTQKNLQFQHLIYEIFLGLFSIAWRPSVFFIQLKDMVKTEKLKKLQLYMLLEAIMLSAAFVDFTRFHQLTVLLCSDARLSAGRSDASITVNIQTEQSRDSGPLMVRSTWEILMELDSRWARQGHFRQRRCRWAALNYHTPDRATQKTPPVARWNSPANSDANFGV